MRGPAPTSASSSLMMRFAWALVILQNVKQSIWADQGRNGGENEGGIPQTCVYSHFHTCGTLHESGNIAHCSFFSSSRLRNHMKRRSNRSSLAVSPDIEKMAFQEEGGWTQRSIMQCSMRAGKLKDATAIVSGLSPCGPYS